MSYLFIDEATKRFYSMSSNGHMTMWSFEEYEDDEDEDEDGKIIHSAEYRLYEGAWRFYVSSGFIFLFTRGSSSGAFVSKISMDDLSLIDCFRVHGNSLSVGYLETIGTEFMFLPSNMLWWYIIKQHPSLTPNKSFAGKNGDYKAWGFPTCEIENEKVVYGTNIVESLILTKNNETHIYCLSCSLYAGSFFSFFLDAQWDEFKRRKYENGPFKKISTTGHVSINDEFHNSFCKMVASPDKRYIAFTQFTHLSADKHGWRFNLFVFDTEVEKIIWGKSIDSKITGNSESLHSQGLPWPCSEPVFTFNSSHILVGTSDALIVFFETQTGAHHLVKYADVYYRFDNLAIHPVSYSLWTYDEEFEFNQQLIPDIRVHLNPEDYTSPKVVPQ